MYGPRPWVSGSLVALLLRAPLVVVPVIVGIVIGLSHLPHPPPAMITFAFDDGYESVYELAFPILSRYDFPATVFVITSTIGQPGYLSLEQLKTLYENGWEIASHSISHPHLSQLDDKQLLVEIKDSKRTLKELGFTVYSFSPPYGEIDGALSLVKQYYFCSLSGLEGINDLPISENERYQLKVKIVRANTTLEELQQLILHLRHQWLILLFHQIDGNGEYSFSCQDFEALVKYVSELGFKPVPLHLIFK